MAETPKQDDRLKAEPKAAVRETPREIEQSREYSEEESLEMLRGMGLNTILPDLPEIPGYHVVWLSTSNPRDSIPNRMRYGYTPVRPSDIPGFNAHETSINQGPSPWGDVVTINEMIAFKIPMERYQLYMRELHHNEPNRQEAALRETADMIRREAEAKGAKLEEFDGMEDLRQQALIRPATFQ